MSEDHLKPIVIASIYEIEQSMKEIGLDKNDIITLIHKRCKGKVGIRDIRITYESIKELEKDVTRTRSG